MIAISSPSEVRMLCLVIDMNKIIRWFIRQLKLGYKGFGRQELYASIIGISYKTINHPILIWNMV
jgi:hypothetical protein